MQSGLLLTTVGVAGIGLMITVVVPVAPVHPLAVAVTEYTPALLAVMFVIPGFCVLEVNVFGPLQLYVVPVLLAVKFKLLPAHNGPLFPATGAAGVVLTTTETVPVPLEPQPGTVAFIV
jgi:hypothetical protein